MTSCPDVDVLIELGRIGADPVAVMRHVTSCPECRGRVTDTAVVREAFAESVHPRPGFVDQVMRAVEAATDEAPAIAPAGGRGAAWAWRMAGGAFGFATALLVVAAGGAAVPVAPSPAVLVGAVLAGAAGVVFSREVPSA